METMKRSGVAWGKGGGSDEQAEHREFSGHCKYAVG